MTQYRNPARVATLSIGMGLSLAAVAIPTRASAQYVYACPPGYYYDGIYGCVPASYYYGPPYDPYPAFGFGSYYGGGYRGGYHGGYRGGYHGGYRGGAPHAARGGPHGGGGGARGGGAHGHR